MISDCVIDLCLPFSLCTMGVRLSSGSNFWEGYTPKNTRLRIRCSGCERGMASPAWYRNAATWLKKGPGFSQSRMEGLWEVTRASSFLVLKTLVKVSSCANLRGLMKLTALVEHIAGHNSNGSRYHSQNHPRSSLSTGWRYQDHISPYFRAVLL